MALRLTKHPLEPPSINNSALRAPERVEVSIPPPVPPETLLLFAKWIGYGDPTPDLCDLKEGVHKYKLAIRPTEIVKAGRRVKILALGQTAYHEPHTPLGQYTTYDPHVVGTVAATLGDDGADVGKTRGSTKTFVIDNECRGNLVECVELEIAGDDGETEPRERRGRKRRWNGDGAADRPEWTECCPSEKLELMAGIRPWLYDHEQECRGKECDLRDPWQCVTEVCDSEKVYNDYCTAPDYDT
ncbi:hypothetical protein C8T65DRAFT_691928 [Cerioporus squamosus]|nr:hypothetical protein C8T65DRAFT_691928 [Cerioporus squamosus]